MSVISKGFWCAGWMLDNEFALWEILHGDRHEYGAGVVTDEDLEELRVLSGHANGWIWTGRGRELTPQLVTFAQSKTLFAEASNLAGEASPTQKDWADLVWHGGNE